MTRVIIYDDRHMDLDGEITMSERIGRSLFVAAAALVGAAGLLEGCTRAEAQGPAPQPPTVTVAHPLVRSEADWTEQSGRFVAVDTVDVRPRVSGYLSAVHFTDGQYVRKGQLLFTIDPLPFEARTAKAKAELAQADARLERARSELKRAETLRAAEAISTEEYDSRREAQAQAIAARAGAQAALQGEALDLGYTRVYAPISGRISDRRVDPGNLVSSGQTVLTQIVSVDPIHFEFSAPDSALPPETRSGAHDALLKLEGESQFAHPARVDFIDNRVDAGTGAVRGRVVAANADGAFTPGQFARVRIYFGAPKPTLLAPEAAIGSDQSRKFVLVVNRADEVEYRQVETGPAVAGGLRVIRAGLKPQDRLVIHGVQFARPGQKVKPAAGRIQDVNASLAQAAAPQG
jgi:RND family efflux transporter MFP subunit